MKTFQILFHESSLSFVHEHLDEQFYAYSLYEHIEIYHPTLS